MSDATFAVASPDGRYAIAGDGTIVTLTGGEPSRALSELDLATSPQYQLAYVDPFTGDDADIVVLSGGAPGYATAHAAVTLLDWRTGRQVASLGEVDGNAGTSGDPAATGVFGSVAAPVQVSGGEGDSRVELRDVGRPPVVIATSASVDRALGLPASRYSTLSPFPDPAGDKVAITVDTVQSGETSPGIVVVNRGGQILASTTAARPADGYSVQWSPDGSSLVYMTAADAGEAVAEWSPGPGSLPPVTRPVPDSGDVAGRCLWSTDGTELLCVMADVASQHLTWLSTSSTGGPFALQPGPGNPITFLRSPGLRSPGLTSPALRSSG
jgi:hypothetical protein